MLRGTDRSIIFSDDEDNQRFLEIMAISDNESTKYNHDLRAMESILEEGVHRGELAGDTPVAELALFLNAQLYGLMVAWCMSDAAVVGSHKSDAFCETIIKPVLEQYMI